MVQAGGGNVFHIRLLQIRRDLQENGRAIGPPRRHDRAQQLVQRCAVLQGPQAWGVRG